MTLRERIKDLCLKNKISLNKLEETLGFGKGYLSKLDTSTPNTTKIKKIADYFDVTVDYLMTGSENKTSPSLNKRDEKDIEKHLAMFRKQLMEQEGLMFNDKPVTLEDLESILSAMEIGMEMVKKRNKEKYTPKKYRKQKDTNNDDKGQGL